MTKGIAAPAMSLAPATSYATVGFALVCLVKPIAVVCAQISRAIRATVAHAETFAEKARSASGGCASAVQALIFAVVAVWTC